MAPAGDDDEQLPTTNGAEDGAPPESEEDYVEAVTRHAKYLGMDPERDGAYMWIAEEVRSCCCYVYCSSSDFSPVDPAAPSLEGTYGVRRLTAGVGLCRPMV